MKKMILLFILVSLLTYSTYSQSAYLKSVYPKSERFSLKEILTKRLIYKSSFVLIAGIFDGTAETVKFHYSSFKKMFPDANDQFWDEDISWSNKYSNNNKANGPAFFGSTTFLVWTTDGYHLMRTLRNANIMVAITIDFCNEKKRWYYYVIDAIVCYIAYNVGFTISYDLIFRK